MSEFPTKEESHYLNCLDDNCEKAFCVGRREHLAELAALKVENERLRKALEKILINPMPWYIDKLAREALKLADARGEDAK